MLAAFVLAAAIDIEARCEQYLRFTPPPIARRTLEEEKCEPSTPLCNVLVAERFANGKGVKPELALADYFLCQSQNEIAPGELEGMFEHLDRMRAGTEKTPLSYCDFITSGYGSTYCANRRWSTELPLLTARLDALSRRSHSNTLATLRQAATAFIRAETDRIGEQSIGGSGHTGFVLDAEVDATTAFVENVERWTQQRTPPATTQSATAVDAELNRVYQHEQKVIDGLGDEVAKWKTLLRDAQRSWITYRDAFASYYAERWRGKASEEELRREVSAELSRQRAKELQAE
jgi:uncharacterized protein YecT (DUF1311 family)